MERIGFMARKDNRGRNLKQGESQRKDGLYMYRYVDERTGNRETIYDTELTSLRERERQIAREMEDGIMTSLAVKKMTVNALFERYLESKKLADTTRANYISIWNNRVRDEIGQLKVVQVKPSHIKLYYSKLTKSGYSHSTIKLIHNLIYPSFEMAVDDDMIRKNPAKGTLGDNGKSAIEKDALTLLQQQNLFHFVKDSKVYSIYLPMLQFMIGTGCRCGELIGLTWSDVDMDEKNISINHQLIYKDYGDGYRFHVTTPKTDAGIRTIPMNETLRKVFAEQKRLNFMRSIQKNVEIEGLTGFIFTSKNGRPLMPNAVNSVLRNIVIAYNKEEVRRAKEGKRKAELMPAISAHTMRHTACTRMAEQGLDMKIVQYIIGHVDISVTMEVYNHITERIRIEKELTKLELLQVI